MRASWLAVYRAALLVAAILGLFLASRAVVHRDKRGGRPLLVLIVGGLVYVGVKLAVSVLRGTPAVFSITRLNVLGAALATSGFFLLVVEYTGLENPLSRRTVGLVAVEPLVANLLVWVDLDLFWVPVGRDPTTVSGYAWELTGFAVANQLYMSLLLASAIGLLVRFWHRSSGTFDSQILTLVAAGTAPLFGNMAYYLGYVRFNLTPVVFVFSGLAITWAIVRGGFLDLLPVSRGEVIDEVDVSVFTLDAAHRVVDLNACARRTFGFDSGAVVGEGVNEAFAERPALGDAYWSLAEEGGQRQLTFDGRHYAVDLTTLTESSGEVVGRSLLVRDVTERTLREQELERKHEQLERFASVVSHDIRNPLNVIQGQVTLARRGEPEEHLDTIASNADRIEEIIQDGLTMTRGTEVEAVEALDAAVLARRAWKHVETSEATLDVRDEFVVEGDPGRLVQLFENLFRNAVEHGGDGVTVRVGELDEEGGGSRGFFVADDGVGIPADERESVLEDGYTTSRAGTGLGLSIVSEVVDAHGWRLHVAEAETGGARFDVRYVADDSRTVDATTLEPTDERGRSR